MGMFILDGIRMEKKNGKGCLKLKEKNEAVLSGHWKDGQMTGEGILYDRNGKIIKMISKKPKKSIR